MPSPPLTLHPTPTPVLAYRLALATLTSTTLRLPSTPPHIIDTLIPLLLALQHGAQCTISANNTLTYTPGILAHATTTKKIEWEVGKEWSAAATLVVLLIPWCKKQTSVTITGVTNGKTGTVDAFRLLHLPLLSQFGITMTMTSSSRGFLPLGGGSATFTCEPVKQLNPLTFIDPGKIRRIRGIAPTARIAPQTVNTIIETARGQLTQHIPDVFIFADTSKGVTSGKSPGFGVSLVAESTTGVKLFAECGSVPGIEDRLQGTPQALAERCVNKLYREIQRGGCVTSSLQPIAILLMCLNTEDVSKIRFGRLTEAAMQTLRDVKSICGLEYKIEEVVEADSQGELILTTVGIGKVNLGRSAI